MACDALWKREGRSANTRPRARRPSAGSAATPSSSLRIASSTHATRRSSGTSFATRACIVACSALKSARRFGCSSERRPKYRYPSHSRWVAMSCCIVTSTRRVSEFG